MIGQFIHPAGFAILAPDFSGADEPRWKSCSISPLVEYMMALSGERGALRLLADVDEQSQAFEALRKCGFAVYTRQRIWQLDGQPSQQVRAETPPGARLTDQDMIPVRNLYNNLVPGLVQQIEPFAIGRSQSLPLVGLLPGWRAAGLSSS